MNRFLLMVLKAVFVGLFFVSVGDKTHRFLAFLKRIQNAYTSLFKGEGKHRNLILVVAMGLSLINITINTYARFDNLMASESVLLNIVIGITSALLVCLVLYFVFGIPLMLMMSVENLFRKMADKRISTQYVISFFLLMLYGTYFIFSKDVLVDASVFAYVGLIVSYLINIKLILNTIQNPLSLFRGESNGFNVIKATLSASLVLLLLVLVNLYFIVLLTFYTVPDAYFCSVPNQVVNAFSLLYYTVISFATIGYGDIVASAPCSRGVAMLIAFTSVLCLGIFIGSVLLVREKKV